MKSLNRNRILLEGNRKYKIYIIYSYKLCLTVWILHNYYFTYSSLSCWLVCCWHHFFFFPIKIAFLHSIFLSGNIIMMLTAGGKISFPFIPKTEGQEIFPRRISSYMTSQVIFQNNFFLYSFLQTFFDESFTLKS